MTVTSYSSVIVYRPRFTLNSRNNFNNPTQIQNIFTQIQSFRPDLRKHYIGIYNNPNLFKYKTIQSNHFTLLRS